MNKEELKEKVVDYAEKVFFYCVKRCNNRTDAEDLSQTILLEIIQNIDKGAHIDNFDYYVWGVCKNQYNMYLRKTIKDRNNVVLNNDIVVQDNSLSPLDEMIKDEKIRRMNQAIKLLSKDYAQILYAYYVEDKTLKFISEELSLPLGTIKKRLFIIRNKLKEYLNMEKLNGKRAYVPKTFASVASYNQHLPFDPHDVVKPLFIKNLLYHIYNNPCTIEDISLEMGMSKPYVEDVVYILLGIKYIIKDGNKYKSNIAFIDKEIVNKVRNGLNVYYEDYINAVIKFAKNNIENYRSKLIDKNISDGLLMWSLLMIIQSYTSEPETIRTKKYGDMELAFCMYEVDSVYDPNNIYISWNGFGGKKNYKLYGNAYPAAGSTTPEMTKLHKRISYNNACNGFNENPSLFANITFNDVEYDKLNNSIKKEVDQLIKLNYMRVDNNIIRIVTPMMKEEDLIKFKFSIQKDEEISKTFSNLFSRAMELVSKEIPEYLKDESNFLVSSVINDVKTKILQKAEKEDLLDFDESHDHFVYNMLLVKC